MTRRSGTGVFASYYLTPRVPGEPSIRVSFRDVETWASGKGTATGSLATHVVHYQRGRGSSVMPRKGDYTSLTNAVIDMSAQTGIAQNQLLYAMSSPDDATVRTRLAALAAGRPAATQALIAREVEPALRGLRYQTQSLESARAFGQLPATAVAGVVGGDAFERLHPEHARLAPMMTERSSAAPQRRREQLYAEPAPPPGPLHERGDVEAERIRHVRLHQTFTELRQALRAGRLRTLPESQQAAAAALAAAFQTWVRHHLTDRSSTEVVAARVDLALALVEFLEAYYPSR